MATDSDRHLVQRIRDGDPAAWQSLIDRYEGRLQAFVERRLRDRGASEDVVQETFIGFANSLPNFDDRRELQTYLFTIASYKITDFLRRKGRRPPLSQGEDAEEMLGQQAGAEPPASAMARSQERRALESDALARHLGTLIRQWQDKGDFLRLKVMELLFVKGWANRDAARFLNIGEQQVANIRFAAIKKLTEHIRDAGLSADVFPELHDDGA